MCAKTQNILEIIILMVSIFLKEADVSNWGEGKYVCLSFCLSSARERLKTASFIGLICMCVYGARTCQPTDFL